MVWQENSRNEQAVITTLVSPVRISIELWFRCHSSESAQRKAARLRGAGGSSSIPDMKILEWKRATTYDIRYVAGHNPTQPSTLIEISHLDLKQLDPCYTGHPEPHGDLSQYTTWFLLLESLYVTVLGQEIYQHAGLV
jgi:hypothetical protein